MINKFSDFEKIIRTIIFDNALETDRIALGLDTPEDVGAGNTGDLFRKDEDFLLIETDIADVRRAGPGMESPRRAWGVVMISYLTKDPYKKILALEELERVAGWFGDKTVGGVRFRQFAPTGNGPLRGFISHDGTIPCDFELRPMTR